MKKTQYVVLGLFPGDEQQGSEQKTLFARAVSSKGNHFAYSPVTLDHPESLVTALDNMCQWYNEIYQRKIVSEKHFEIVAWNKTQLLSHLEWEDATPFARDWLDFTSYYAGVHGLTPEEARFQLNSIDLHQTGASRIAKITKIFEITERTSRTFQTVLSVLGTSNEAFNEAIDMGNNLRELLDDETK